MAFNWKKFPWTNLHDLNLDWIIQTVKTLEENLADAIALMRTTAQNVVDSTISALLTGDGDFTVNKNGNVSIVGNRVQMNGSNVQISGDTEISGSGDFAVNKTGDVNLTGNNVRITSGSQAQMIGGAFISDGGQQITLHNPNSSTSMTADYSSGILHLMNNQDEAAGVALYAINTPADSAGDNSSFAANVGYVKAAVGAVNTALATETENRTSGDANLQSEIDRVKTQLQIESNERQANDTAIRQSAIFNVTANISTDFTGGNITLDSTVISQLKAALSINRLVSLTLKNFTVASNLYQTRYLLLDDYASPPSANGEYTANFYNVGKTLSATIDTATGVLTYTEF